MSNWVNKWVSQLSAKTYRLYSDFNLNRTVVFDTVFGLFQHILILWYEYFSLMTQPSAISHLITAETAPQWRLKKKKKNLTAAACQLVLLCCLCRYLALDGEWWSSCLNPPSPSRPAASSDLSLKLRRNKLFWGFLRECLNQILQWLWYLRGMMSAVLFNCLCSSKFVAQVQVQPMRETSCTPMTGHPSTTERHIETNTNGPPTDWPWLFYISLIERECSACKIHWNHWLWILPEYFPMRLTHAPVLMGLTFFSAPKKRCGRGSLSFQTSGKRGWHMMQLVN